MGGSANRRTACAYSGGLVAQVPCFARRANIKVVVMQGEEDLASPALAALLPGDVSATLAALPPTKLPAASPAEDVVMAGVDDPTSKTMARMLAATDLRDMCARLKTRSPVSSFPVDPALR